MALALRPIPVVCRHRAAETRRLLRSKLEPRLIMERGFEQLFDAGSARSSAARWEPPNAVAKRAPESLDFTLGHGNGQDPPAQENPPAPLSLIAR